MGANLRLLADRCTPMLPDAALQASALFIPAVDGDGRLSNSYRSNRSRANTSRRFYKCDDLAACFDCCLRFSRMHKGMRQYHNDCVSVITVVCVLTSMSACLSQITVEWVLQGMHQNLRDRFSVEPKLSKLNDLISKLVDEECFEDVDDLPRYVCVLVSNCVAS